MNNQILTAPQTNPINNVKVFPTSSKREDAHTVSLLVQNKPGVLVRIAVVFSRRGYNIDSLVVSSGLRKDLSRITITAFGDKTILSQVIKQCRKLINVISASEHLHENVIEKELALVKLIINSENRARLFQYANHFKAQTQDITRESAVIQVTGSSEKIDAFVDVLREFEIIEIIRSGKMIMTRGKIPT